MTRSKPFYFLFCKIDILYIVSDIYRICDIEYIAYLNSNRRYLMSYIRYHMSHFRYRISYVRYLCKISDIYLVIPYGRYLNC